MMHAAVDRRVRAMYVMGENPMLSDPNLTHVEEGLRALDFLVVQDIFLSETALLAHVVLPAAASLGRRTAASPTPSGACSCSRRWWTRQVTL
ncbi:MAG: molybdopterin-dependent oxidoreductase [Caldilineaceae bacterium]